MSFLRQRGCTRAARPLPRNGRHRRLILPPPWPVLHTAGEKPDPCIGRELPGIWGCCCGRGDTSRALRRSGQQPDRGDREVGREARPAIGTCGLISRGGGCLSWGVPWLAQPSDRLRLLPGRRERSAILIGWARPVSSRTSSAQPRRRSGWVTPAGLICSNVTTPLSVPVSDVFPAKRWTQAATASS